MHAELSEYAGEREADRATPATSTAALMASPFLRELQRLQLLNAC